MVVVSLRPLGVEVSENCKVNSLRNSTHTFLSENTCVSVQRFNIQDGQPHY